MQRGQSTSPSRPPSPARVLHFDAHLVVADATTKQLRASPCPGLLSVNTTDRVVHFAYKRGSSGGYQHTLREPHKCVVAGLGLQLWSRVSKCALRCRLVGAPDKQGCLEVLQIMGVRVVDVSPQRFITQQRRVHGHRRADHDYAAEFDSLAAAFAHPRQSRALASDLSAHNASEQLATDIATISRTFFGGSLS